MYQIHVRQGDETIKYSASEQEVGGVKKAQASGQSGFWIHGEYISLGSVRAITKSVEKDIEEVNYSLKRIQDENPKDQKERIHKRLEELRNNWGKKLS